MIKIKIKCFSHVKYALGTDGLDIVLEEGTTLESLEKKYIAIITPIKPP